ncbi:hypothetical protein GM708_04080 [Vibrio cholerae]|jgi:hypothetical protein|nr:hypothetical protein [Vibrio cholerae]
MTALVIQWIALGLCAVGALVRLPGVRKGHGRTVFAALVLLTVAVGLSIDPMYHAVDRLLGGVNLANLLLRLTLYAVFVLLGVRMAAAFGSLRARRLIAGPIGVVILSLTVAATLSFFLASDVPTSSTGLRAFGDQGAVQQYAAVGRLYPAYVAACLVGPAIASVFDRHYRVIHRVACGLLALGFLLVVVFVILRLTTLDLMAWDVILPFSAIVLAVTGLCLIWLSSTLSRRTRGRENPLA